MKKFDVAIAGGGVIGGAIALELARAGLRVAVFDRQQPGQEASWASAGILSPAPESPGMIVMVPLGKASLALYPKFVAEVEEILEKAQAFGLRGRSRRCFRTIRRQSSARLSRCTTGWDCVLRRCAPKMPASLNRR